MPTRTRRLFVTLIAVVISAQLAVAQRAPATTTAATDALTKVIAVDPQIREGRLPNGLQYFVRANGQPRGRAELRLVVNAGSVLEDDNQRGLAHFVEHMAFNGTEHFPGQDVVAFIQSLGMRFGAHVNAHTSFDETVYQLQIPTDRLAVIDRSLLIMEDWAHNVSFEPEAVEQGARRRARRVAARTRRRLAPARRADADSVEGRALRRTLADRPPGDHSERHLCPAEAVLHRLVSPRPDGRDRRRRLRSGRRHVDDRRAFPRRFRPRRRRRPRPMFTVPPHDETLYALAADREATATTVTVTSVTPAGEQRTVGAYRQQMVERLFSRLLSKRLDEVAQRPNPPFNAAQTSRGLFVRSATLTTLAALVPDGGAERGLEALFTELERVVQFGFTQSELDRDKLDSQRYLDEALLEKDKSPSGPLADELVRHVVQEEPVPGIVYEQAMSPRFLPEITLAEINALARSWIPESNRVVSVSAPERAGLALPTAGQSGGRHRQRARKPR